MTDAEYNQNMWLLPDPSFTGKSIDVASTSTSTNPLDLLNSISSTVKNVVDFGVGIQQKQLEIQSKASDLEFQKFLKTLDLQTAVVQATGAAKVAQYQTAGQVAQAAKAASQAGSTGLALSPLMLIGAGVVLFLALRK